MDENKLLSLGKDEAEAVLAAMPDREKARALAFLYEARHGASVGVEAAADHVPPKRKPTLGVTLLVVIIGLVALVVMILLSSPRANQDPVDRIAQACERQYRYDENKIAECRIQLSIERITEAERLKMDRARREAR